LTNAAKYAKAHAISVRLQTRGQHQLELEIVDDGQGFELAAVPAGHFGLAMMRERAEAVGATLRIQSQVGQGTGIVLTWRGTRQAAAEHARGRREGIAARV
jgi:signal transduction histidine kinase